MSGEYVLGQSIFRVPSAYDDELSLGSYGLYGLGDIASGSAAVDALLARANAELANLIRPSWGAIDQSSLPPEQKALLKNRPVDFFLQAVEKIENLAVEVIIEANRMSGVSRRTVGIPRVNAMTVDMDPQPDVDGKLPTQSLRKLVKHLRLAMLYITLLGQAPHFLAAAVAKVFAKYAVQGGQALKAFIDVAGPQAAQAAQAAIATAQTQAEAVAAQARRAGQDVQTSVQSAGQSLLDNAAKAASSVPLPSPPRLFGLGSLGQGGPAEGAAAGGGGGTVLTVGGLLTLLFSPPVIAALIGGIFGVIMASIQASSQVGVAYINSKKQPDFIPGNVKPGPDGSTDGNWIGGKWYPRDTPKVDLSTTLTSPAVIGAVIGGLFLLYATTQKRG